jgi:competence protein ComEA
MNYLRKLALVLFFAPLLCLAQPVIDINSADAQTLAEHIDGVGLKKAEAIVRYREENGPFRAVDELAKINGIGKKTIENNRAVLSVNNKQ